MFYHGSSAIPRRRYVADCVLTSVIVDVGGSGKCGHIFVMDIYKSPLDYHINLH